MEEADESKRAAAVARLVQLRDVEQLSAAHVRLAAEGLGVSGLRFGQGFKPETAEK